MPAGTSLLSESQLQQVHIEPQQVNLKIECDLLELALGLEKPICLGRLDPPADLDTVVDLEEIGGMEKGVSRCHARITKRNGKLAIEDLGSLNGTFVNARKLAPYIPTKLEDGDYVHLGTLLIQVNIPQTLSHLA